MKRAARCGALLVLLLATLGARAPEPPPDVPPSLVLQRYEEALASLKTPPFVIFEYSVEQSGLRNLEQVHRVYRSAARERDETLRVNGTPLKPPAVRVLQGPDRYDVARLAPKPGDYTFTFEKRAVVEGRPVYTFRSDIQKVAGFTVTRVDVDAERRLPRTRYLRSANGSTQGAGRVRYGPQGEYWLAAEASVEARTGAGKSARERITWAQYGFPQSLPASTFSPPRPQDSPSP